MTRQTKSDVVPFHVTDAEFARRHWEIRNGINLNPGFTEYDDGKTPPGKNAAHIARLKAMTREERAKYLADTYGIR